MWICPETEQMRGIAIFKGELQSCPSQKSLKGFSGTSRVVNVAGGWSQGREGPQRKCFPGLEMLKKEESLSRLRSGFCLVEVWEFHQVCSCVVTHVPSCAQAENMSLTQMARILPLNDQLFYSEVSVYSGEPASLFMLKKFLIHNWWLNQLWSSHGLQLLWCGRVCEAALSWAWMVCLQSIMHVVGTKGLFRGQGKLFLPLLSFQRRTRCVRGLRVPISPLTVLHPLLLMTCCSFSGHFPS